MFDIILYNNRAEPNRLDKTTYIDRYTTLKGTLKNSTSIINPTIIIEFNDRQDYVVDGDNILVMSDGVRVVDVIALVDFLQANYAHIPIFKRYYYITDIVSVRNNLWEIQMAVDVLMSYKDDILKQECIVARNEFDYDNMLIDGKVPSDINDVITVYFPLEEPTLENEYNGTFITKAYNIFGDSNEYKIHKWNFDDYTYVFNTLSKFTSTIEIMDKLYNPSLTSNAVFFVRNVQYTIPEPIGKTPVKYLIDKILEPDFFTSLGTSFQNPADFLMGLYVLPFDLCKGLDELTFTYVDSENKQREANPFFIHFVGYVYIGDTNLIPNVSDRAIESSKTIALATASSTLRMWAKINIPTIDNFIDKEPYSIYHIFLPFVGLVEISSDAFERNLRYVVMDIDIQTGDIVYTLNATEPNLYTPLVADYQLFNGNIYVNCSFGSTNKVDIQRANFERVNNFLWSTIKNIGTIASGANMRTPKRGKISSKGRAEISSGVEAIADDTFDFLLSTVTSQGTSVKSMSLGESSIKANWLHFPYILKKTKKYYYPDNYNHYYGRPLMQQKTLNNTNGFTIISEIHLENIGTASLGELSEIEQLLLSGVILP